MALATANGADVVSAHIVLPRVGAWHADLVVDRATLTGLDHQVRLSFGDAGVAFVGSLVRGGVFADKLRLRIAAGAGGLFSAQMPSKAYQGVTLRIPVTDALNAGGEVLSAAADQGLLATVLQKWISVRQGAAAAIASLLKPFGAAWRFNLDGTFWLGTEAWPVLEPDHVLVDEQLDVGRVEIASEGPALVPGVTFLGKRVGRVEHRLDAHSFRTVVWHE